jgi:hypothetical protein
MWLMWLKWLGILSRHFSVVTIFCSVFFPISLSELGFDDMVEVAGDTVPALLTVTPVAHAKSPLGGCRRTGIHGIGIRAPARQISKTVPRATVTFLHWLLDLFLRRRIHLHPDIAEALEDGAGTGLTFADGTWQTSTAIMVRCRLEILKGTHIHAVPMVRLRCSQVGEGGVDWRGDSSRNAGGRICLEGPGGEH